MSPGRQGIPVLKDQQDPKDLQVSKGLLALKDRRETKGQQALKERLALLGIPGFRERRESLGLQVRLGIKGRRGTLEPQVILDLKE
ncbi:hypothetical protein GCM10008968_31970 [Bacillus horti]